MKCGQMAGQCIGRWEMGNSRTASQGMAHDDQVVFV